jgi:hypothetical protein
MSIDIYPFSKQIDDPAARLFRQGKDKSVPVVYLTNGFGPSPNDATSA